MGCALLGLSAAGSGFLGAHMTASIGGADMPVVRIACPRKKAHVRNDAPEGKGGRESRVGGEVMGERGIGMVMLPMIATPKPCVL